MNKPLQFKYTILGVEGQCFAVSVAHAVARARVDYVQTYMKSGPPGTIAFKKALLYVQEYPITLELSPVHTQRAELIYRNLSRDGYSTQIDLAEADYINNICNDLKKLK